MTLLELLIVLGIVGLFLSLSLWGVMRVREAANVAESKNNLRQIVLAVHQFASSHQGRLPVVGNGDDVEIAPKVFMQGKQAPALLVQILPYVDPTAIRNKSKFRPVAVYLSPADPSAAHPVEQGAAVASYAANGEVFKNDPSLSATFADGTSNTIAFGEHYGHNCNGTAFLYWRAGGHHRASFADGFDDVTPVTEGSPPVSTPSAKPKLGITGPRTFQFAPSIKGCRPALPQTPHSSGMVTAMADGSVRQLAPGISPAVFWGAVTPRSGEIPGSEW